MQLDNENYKRNWHFQVVSSLYRVGLSLFTTDRQYLKLNTLENYQQMWACLPDQHRDMNNVLQCHSLPCTTLGCTAPSYLSSHLQKSIGSCSQIASLLVLSHKLFSALEKQNWTFLNFSLIWGGDWVARSVWLGNLCVYLEGVSVFKLMNLHFTSDLTETEPHEQCRKLSLQLLIKINLSHPPPPLPASVSRWNEDETLDSGQWTSYEGNTSS